MKKLFTLFALIQFTQLVFATTLYDQLCQFNPNWKKYEHRAPTGDALDFKADKEIIQTHLSSVLAILLTNPVAHLTAEQYNSRMYLIEILDGYCSDGNFPLNAYCHGRTPVFIDDRNTHCAVGFLLQQTGYEDMARCIATSENYAWVKDIHFTELVNWQQSSGLSLEELKLIQGAYDYYMPDAFFLPNKYEIPQKPACMIAYFENRLTGESFPAKKENIWCYGEGENGVLNGRWQQNYAVGKPWIVGYFKDGKRTGQWEEYYQGTTQLCRTEHWSDDQLNGYRKRYSREEILIEEILFKDGDAVTKTNYDFENSLMWVRKPIDASMVWTEVFSIGGALIAKGYEKVHNPGNLLWFQNIELTALNSVAITARDLSASEDINVVNFRHGFRNPHSINLYNTPPLVNYKKEGNWVYYNKDGTIDSMINSVALTNGYTHQGMSPLLLPEIISAVRANPACSSLVATYKDDRVQKIVVDRNIGLKLPDIRSNAEGDAVSQEHRWAVSFFTKLKVWLFGKDDSLL